MIVCSDRQQRAAQRIRLFRRHHGDRDRRQRLGPGEQRVEMAVALDDQPGQFGRLQRQFAGRRRHHRLAAHQQRARRRRARPWLRAARCRCPAPPALRPATAARRRHGRGRETRTTGRGRASPAPGSTLPSTAEISEPSHIAGATASGLPSPSPSSFGQVHRVEVARGHGEHIEVVRGADALELGAVAGLELAQGSVLENHSTTFPAVRCAPPTAGAGHKGHMDLVRPALAHAAVPRRSVRDILQDIRDRFVTAAVGGQSVARAITGPEQAAGVARAGRSGRSCRRARRDSTGAAGASGFPQPPPTAAAGAGAGAGAGTGAAAGAAAGGGTGAAKAAFPAALSSALAVKSGRFTVRGRFAAATR